MAKTASTMLDLGTKAPNFSLPDTNNRIISLKDFEHKDALLVMFISNHCPFVQHIRAEIAKIGKEYQKKNIGIIAINSNDIQNYPDDSPEKMKEEVLKAGYSFPYLFDESQAVAKAYQAACTPDFFLFDKYKKLAYRGQLDDSRPGSSIPVTGKDLRSALDSLLAGKPPSHEQKPSLGCNIKWKQGNEPSY